MEENVNKLHIKCADFNSSARVIVYAECIYVFLNQTLVLVAEYRVDRGQTLQWRLPWRISDATNWSQK